MWTRRGLLTVGGVGLAGLALPGPAARALASADQTRFVFVFARGGWDPLCVFAPLYDSPNIEMEPDSAARTIGDLKFVDHPERPSVAAFFEQWSAQALVLNGIAVHSVAHETCEKLVLTGHASGEQSDWATIAGTGDPGAYTVPHLNVAGPVFPGEFGVDVARTGLHGQLDGLLSAGLLAAADSPVPVLSTGAEQLLDEAVRTRSGRRAQTAATPLRARLFGRHADALARSDELKRVRDAVDFVPGELLTSQVVTAIPLLAGDVCRCISLSEAASWDSHEQNHTQQTTRFEALFGSLAALMTGLANTSGTDGMPLLDRTIVVVLSEMGRTPRLNGLQGRDHWPYTSALLLGGGLRGGRSIGGYDEFYNGRHIDPSSLALADGAPELNVQVLGATLLALAGLDPAEHLPRSGAPLEGLRG